eukprot:scaffold731_cov224-Chaetoceros_neogracile.AAC.13
MRHQLSSLFMSETEESSVPRKRRKRKDGKNTEVAQKLSEPEPVVEMIEEVVIVEKAKPVEVKIQDIRDLVSGKAPEVVPEPKEFVDEYDDDDELEDDEEYEYYYEEDEKEFDDTVQIAFNGIFEAIVQPALGILMIGSAAGSLFGTPAEQ